MVMQKVSSMVSSRLGDTLANIRNWGDLFYNAGDYGIVSGGVDVTSKLQDLVNLANSEGRTTVVFPAGVYTVTSIINDVNIVYFGDGASFAGGYAKVINSLSDLLGVSNTLENHLEDQTPHRQFMSDFDNWDVTPIENRDSFRVDTGDYGIENEFHGGAKVIASISGAISVPPDAIDAPNQANGVVGYGKSANPHWNAVGGYFQGQADAHNTKAWGTNPLVEDCGYDGVNVWGCEVNVNVTNPQTVARGIDIVGGSTVQPSIGIALRIGPLGTFLDPFIKWTEGIRTSDGSTDRAIVIGSKLNAVSDSQQLVFRGRYGVEGQYHECIMESSAGGVFTMLSPDNGFITIQGQAASTAYPALNVVGNKVGIMTSSCVYTLQVNGDAQLSGMFGCNGATPQSKQAVNAAAADPATTMALVNQLRTALINNGICI